MTKAGVLTFILACVHVLLCLQLAVQPKKISNNTSIGQPYCFSQRKFYLAGIEDFCVQDGYVYLLYRTKGILEIYTLEGVYVRSYAIYHETNGGGTKGLFVNQKEVLIEDQFRGYYSFADGQWIEYIVGTESVNEHLLKTLSKDTYTTDGQNRYVLRNASIYKEMKGMSMEIIHRPIIFTLFQGATLYIVSMFWIVVTTVIFITVRKWTGMGKY